MDLRELKNIIAVAEAGSFRRASIVMGVHQSTLSRSVAKLEEELGVSFFERNRSGVRITNAGQKFLQRARRVLAEADIASLSARAAGTANEGSICIGVVASIASGRTRSFLRDWKAEHAEVLLDFVEGAPGEHIQAILARRMDLALLAGDPTPAGCDAELVWSEAILVALAHDHRLADESSIAWTAMLADPFIVTRSAPGPEIHDYLVKNLSGISRHPEVSWHSVGRDTLMAMVGLGVGISLVSAAEAGVSYPGVTFVPLAGERLPFSMIWSPQNDNPALRRFLSAARVYTRLSRRETPG